MHSNIHKYIQLPNLGKLISENFKTHFKPLRFGYFKTEVDNFLNTFFHEVTGLRYHWIE